VTNNWRIGSDRRNKERKNAWQLECPQLYAASIIVRRYIDLLSSCQTRLIELQSSGGTERNVLPGFSSLHNAIPGGADRMASEIMISDIVGAKDSVLNRASEQ
jgi:hypothetical protein